LCFALGRGVRVRRKRGLRGKGGKRGKEVRVRKREG
jgi:hypothetical protein